VIATVLTHMANIFHMNSPFDPLHSDGYNFWSGIGSDFGEATILIAAIAWWKHRDCQVRGCWRFHVRNPTAGGHYVCKKHHPAHEGDHLSVEQIETAHREGLAASQSPILPE
jgi:hypothetical protein